MRYPNIAIKKITHKIAYPIEPLNALAEKKETQKSGLLI